MATYYAINAGGNWGTAGTWSTVATKSSARVGGAVLPTSADTCILDDYSGQVTVNVTNAICKILNCVSNGNYANTLTFTAGQKLQIATTGSLVFSSAMTIAGTGTLEILGTVSLTSNGKTFTGALTFTTSGTKTLVDNWSVTGLFTTTTTTQTINRTGVGAGDTLTTAGGFRVSGTTAGTTKIVITGGTYSHQYSGTPVSNSIDFAGNVTITTNINYKTGTMRYVSGVITATNAYVVISGNCSLDVSAITFKQIYYQNPSTITLLSDLHCVRFGEADDTGGFLDMHLAGAFNVYCEDFRFLEFSYMYITAGQTLYISNSMSGNGLLYSTVASSKAYIVYTGALVNIDLWACEVTDIDFTGSNYMIDNWQGGGLVRSLGVRNLTSENTQGIFGII